METLHQWELEIISVIQQISNPLLDNIFRVLSMLGDELFYLLILPILLWTIDRRFGARVAVLFLLSAYVNIMLKELFQQPRPFALDQTLGISTSDGFGLPSGHAQLAIVVWGSIACRVQQLPLKIACVGMILLIGVSRVYLGVHFPTDVIAGWLVGICCLILYTQLSPKIEPWLKKVPLTLFTTVFSFLLIALFVLYPIHDTATVIGALLGMGIGLSLMHRYLSYGIEGTWVQHGARVLLGSMVVFFFFFGLRLLFPSEEEAWYFPFRFARYGIIGFWATFGASWFFLKLGLFSPNSDSHPFR
jgi:membrane-associated phospholipid phosphatase